MSSLSGKDGPRLRHAADASQPYETIGVDKSIPIIGAEISGVDLAKPLSNRTVDEIHRALAENIDRGFFSACGPSRQFAATAAIRSISEQSGYSVEQSRIYESTR